MKFILDKPFVIFQHKHGFTVKKQDGCKTGSASASSVPRSEPEMVPSGQTSVSTPQHSTNSENPQTPAPTPASDRSCSSPSPPGSPEPSRGVAEAAETDADDVFSPADEVILAPGVLALGKKPSDVKASEEIRAPGTIDEVLSFPPSLLRPGMSYYKPRPYGYLGIPACCFLCSFQEFGVCWCCFVVCKHLLIHLLCFEGFA